MIKLLKELQLLFGVALMVNSHIAACQGNLANAGHVKPIEITSPRGSEKWSAGSLHHITWRSASLVSFVRIDYSIDDGKTWTPAIHASNGRPATSVTTSSNQINQFLWKVPASSSSRCKIKITNAGEQTMEDESRSNFTIIPSEESSNYQWICVTKRAGFAARDGAGALVFRNKMWLLGGWNPTDRVHFPRICNSEVWSSTDGVKWTLENPQAQWEGRHTAGYVVHNGRMWIVGGDCNQHHYQNDVWSSADGINWNLVNDNVPWAPRALHYTLAFNNKIWVMGGQTMPGFAGGQEMFYNDVWNSPDGVTWTRVIDKASWLPRGMIGGNVVFQDKMWILGGGTYDTPKTHSRKFYNDVWSSADGVKWHRCMEFAPWSPRQYHEVAVFDNKMWVLEGYNRASGNRRDVWYSADGVNWYELPDTPWSPRHAASVFVYNDALWIVAGNNMSPDVWKLTRMK